MILHNGNPLIYFTVWKPFIKDLPVVAVEAWPVCCCCCWPRQICWIFILLFAFLLKTTLWNPALKQKNMILRVRFTTTLARSFGNLLKCEHSLNRSICSVTGKCLKSGPVQKVLILKPNYCLSSKINTSARHPRGWNIFNRTIYSIFLDKIDVNMQTENAPVHKIVVRTMAKKGRYSGMGHPLIRRHHNLSE